ncbi:MAG: hypothetical protein QM831_30805 [Kofleriaceae bacterium]
MTDATLTSMLDAVTAGGGEIAALRLTEALAQLDAIEGRAIYLRLADAADPIAAKFARLPNREMWRSMLRGETRAPRNRVYARRAA